MKTPKPWYRNDRDAWYICLHGRQIRLAIGRQNREVAKKECHRLLAEDPGRLTDHRRPLTVVRLAKLFLRWLRKHREPRTVEFYRYFLRTFCKGKRRFLVDRLAPEHLDSWLDRQNFNSTSQNRAIGAVKTMLNWAVRKRALRDNPLKLVQKPPCLRRERILTPGERKAILARVRGRNFKMFLFALGQTGCRPGEVASVTAEQFHASGLWILRKHKTKKKTGKPRVIYLSAPMLKLTKLLMRQHPEGPIFRNDDGNPWNRNSVRCRLRRIRAKLNLPGLCAYLWRHTYTTDALERGVPIATVAELLGHTSTATISRHYGHLDQKANHLHEAVERATRHPGR